MIVGGEHRQRNNEVQLAHTQHNRPLGLDLALGVQIVGELPERNGRTGFKQAAGASTLSSFVFGAGRHRSLRCSRSMKHES